MVAETEEASLDDLLVQIQIYSGSISSSTDSLEKTEYVLSLGEVKLKIRRSFFGLQCRIRELEEILREILPVADRDGYALSFEEGEVPCIDRAYALIGGRPPVTTKPNEGEGAG